MGTVFLLTMRALGRGRRLLVVAILLAVPSLLAIAYRANDTHADSTRFAVQLFAQLFLPILLPLTVLVFATSALGSEIEDRTLLYLTLRPVSRLAIVMAKLLAALLIALVLVEVALAVAYLIAAQGIGQGSTLGAFLLAGLGGCIAYSGLFLLVGLLAPRRALVVGFIYVLLWEGTAAGLSTALATLSVRRYIEGTLHAGLGTVDVPGITWPALDGTTSAIVLILIAAVAVALTTWRLHRLELS